MVNLLKSELYKLRHSLVFWEMALFSLLLGSLMLLDSRQDTSSLFFASLHNTPILYFLTIIYGALFIGNDFGSQTLHSFVSAGHKRSFILLAKTFVYQMGCVLILGLPLILHGIWELIVWKVEMASVETMLLTGFSILISILAMGMVSLLCAFIFRDMGRTLAVPMVLFFLEIFILNGDHALRISIFLPIGQLRLISLEQYPLSSVALIGMDCIWILVLYMAAYVAFCHLDLK